MELNKKREEIREELIHWFADYDSKVEKGNAPMVTDTLDSLFHCLHSQGCVMRLDNGANLEGCCIARLEPLIEEQ